MSATCRRLSLAPSQEEEGFREQFPHSVITEILLRLPLFSVFASRCVCKSWLSLTTSPYFIQQWELYRAQFRQDPPLALFLQHSINSTEREFLLCSGVPKFKVSSFSLDFLPMSHFGITIIGSCEDLLLCCNKETPQSDYVVVNPITHQWITVPPALRIHSEVFVDFVFKPASVVEARKGGELSYTVVQIRVFAGSRIEFDVEIFSSDDGQWNECVMTLADELIAQCWRRRGATCNGFCLVPI